MVKISVCVITKNEASCIGRCLQSIKQIANEMIVVDTGSSDDTLNIAQKYGAKTFFYKWCDDFSAARNYALNKAKGDWIIFLDADEYIVEAKPNSVRTTIQKLHPNRQVDALRCPMIHLEGSGGQPRSTNATIRIFRHLKTIYYAGLIHESIVRPGQKSVRVANVDKQVLTVYHTGYTKETINEKIRRNTRMLEKEAEQGIVREFTYCYLSSAYHDEENYPKAIDYAYKAIQHMGRIDRDIDYKPYVVLIKSMSKLSSYSEQDVLRICHEADEKFPNHPEILLEQGLYCRKIGRLEAALTLLLRAVAANTAYRDFNRNNDFNLVCFQAYLNIAQLYNLKNQPTDALEYYIKALQQEKFNLAAFRELIFLIRRQEPAEVIYFLNSLYQITNEADVRFLVKYLSSLKVQGVLDYYQHILRNKFQERTVNGLILLNHGKFEAVFPIFADSFIKNGNYDMELLAVLSIFVNDRPDLVTLLGTQLKPSFQKMIAIIFRKEAVRLTADDFPYFRNLVREMAYMGLDHQVSRLLNLGERFFAMDALYNLARMFVQNDLFRYALEVYLCDGMRPKNGQQASQFYFEVGYCNYRLKKFAAAVDCFAVALRGGYEGTIIFDFLHWSYQQCREATIQNQIKRLEEEYGSLMKKVTG